MNRWIEQVYDKDLTNEILEMKTVSWNSMKGKIRWFCAGYIVGAMISTVMVSITLVTVLIYISKK